MPVKSASKAFSLKKFYTTSALAAAGVLTLASPAQADGVVNGTFVSGSGTFTQEQNKTTITVNSTNSITEFPEYNIGADQEVHYQSSVGSARNLSRVTGGNASSILGKLTSTDVSVYLVNPNGVFFGKNAVVDVPNLIVSTSDITNANFNAGKYSFDIKGKQNAKIENQGSITVSEGGMAALVAPEVENSGIIVAKKGKVALAGGEQFTLDMYGDNLVNFAVSDSEKQHLVKQSGKIAAENGVVLLTVQDAGKVVGSVVNMSGVTEASQVKVKGDEIVLEDGAQINASGANGGGNVSLQAHHIKTAKTSKITADATVNGNGGNVSIIADDKLDVDGTISAKGAGTGTGGFVETSAPNVSFGDNLTIDTTDANGGAGSWLIDPTTNFTIGSSVQPLNINYLNNTALSAALALSNVTIETNKLGSAIDNLAVNADITSTAFGNRSLTLKSNDSITVGSGVNINSVFSGLNVNLQSANVTVNGGINTHGGNVSVTNKNGSTNNGFTTGSTGSINAGGGNITADSTNIILNGAIAGNTVTLKAADHIDLNAAIKAATLTGNTTKTVNVLSNNGSINQAVTLANADTGSVNLAAGEFNQTVLVNKKISLNGSLSGNSIIKPTSVAQSVAKNSGGNLLPIVLVTGSGATIQDIYVDGSKVTQTIGANDTLAGVVFNNAEGASIMTSSISGLKKNSIGVAVQNSDNGVIEQNTIANDADNETAVLVDNSKTAVLQSNTINGSGANSTGIKVTNHSTGTSINSNIISLANDATNIIVDNSKNVTIVANTDAVAALDILIENGADADISSETFNTDTGTTAIKVDGAGSKVTFDSGGDKFNGNGQYINFENGAMAGTTTDISGLEFDDVIGGSGLAGDATDAESFALEDRLHHKVDDSTVGLLTWKAGTIFATVNSTLQGAIDAATSGETVKANAGTYNEWIHVANKDINLVQGNVSGTVVIAPTGTAGSLNQFTNFFDSTINDAAVLVQNGNVNITGITVDGANAAATATGHRLVGYGYQNAGGTILVSTAQNTATDVVAQADSSKGDNARVFNYLYSSAKAYTSSGIEVDGNQLTANLDGNYLRTDATANNGIRAGRGVKGEITGTQISGNYVGGNALIALDSVADNFKIQNVDLSMAHSNNTGISVRNTNSTNIIDSKIYGAATGIDAVNANNLVISSDDLQNNAIGAALTGSLNAIVNNSTIKNGGYGLYVSGSDNVLIQSSTISGNSQDGAQVVNSNNFHTAGASFLNNSGNGIYLNNAQFAHIIDSNVNNNGTGVYLVASNDAIIGSSTVNNNGYAGVFFNASDRGTVNNSTVNGNYTGVLFSNSKDGLIQSSTISGSSHDGAQAVDSQNFHANNVKFLSNGGNGIYLSNSSAAQISNSTISQNGTGIYAVNSINALIGSSDVTNNTGTGVFFDASDNGIINNSNVSNNYTGVVFSNSKSGLVQSSTTSSNTEDGVKFIAGSNGGSVNYAVAINNNGGAGIEANASTGITVNGGDISNNATGIKLANGSNGANIIGGTKVHGNSADGISADASTGLNVNAAQVYSNTGAGVRLNNGSTGATITNGSLANNTVYGAIAVGSDNLTVNGTEVSGGIDGVDFIASNNGIVENAHIHNLQTGVYANSASNLTVDTVHSENNTYGAYIASSSGAKIKNSTFNNNYKGLVLDGSNAAAITASTFNNNTTGIYATGSDGAKIVNSFIFANSGDGIYAENSSGLTVDPTYIHNNGTGVELVSSTNATIQDSYIYDNTNDGVDASRADGLKITNSHITGNKTGVKATLSNNITLQKSEFANNSADGVYAEFGNGLAVNNSSFHNNSANGLNLFDVDSAAISNKSSFANNGTGLNTFGGAGLTVDNSTFSGNTTGAELTFTDGAVLTNDKFIGNSTGLYSFISNGITVSNATVAGNTTGISLYDTTNDTIKGGNVTGNTTGISIFNATGTDISTTIAANGTGALFTDGHNNSIHNSTVTLNKTGISAELSNGLYIGNDNILLNTTGVAVTNSIGAVVENSTLSLNTTGIDAATATGLVLNNDTVSYGKTGISLANSNGAVINNSAISHNTTAGISANSSSGLVVNPGNTISNNTVGLALDNGSNGASINGATFANNTTGVKIAGGSTGLNLTNTAITGGTTGILATGDETSLTFGTGDSIHGQSGKFIDLENNALKGGTLDVSKVAFTDVISGDGQAAHATDLESFALQDKLHDKLNDINTGLVTWRANTLFATTGTTIQGAIDASSTGNVIKVNSGNYNESIHIIGTDLTLAKGDGVTGTITLAPTSAPGALNQFKNFYDNTINDAVVLVQDGSADISGFTIDGSQANSSGAGHRLVGIGYNNASGTLNGVVVQNIADTNAQLGTDIVAQADSSAGAAVRNFAVLGSTIQNFQAHGIEADGNQLTANLGNGGGNFVKGGGTGAAEQTGIEAGYGAKGQVAYTTFLGINSTGSTEIALNDNANGFSIHDNALNYGTENTSGITINGGKSVNISNNTIYGNTTGIKVDGSSKLSINTNDIEHNTTGVLINNSTNATINNSTVINNGTGVLAKGSDGLKLVDSSFNYNTGNGVRVSNSDGLVANNSSFNNNGKNGLVLVGSDDAVIKNGSAFKYNSGNGIKATNSNNLTVNAATLVNNIKDGIKLAKSNGATISGTEIYGSNIGIEANRSKDLLVKNSSDIHDNTAGIQLTNSNGATINNSDVHDNHYAGLVANSSNNLTVKNSDIHHNTTYGIDLENSTGTLVLNTQVHHNGDIGINVANSANTVVKNSKIYNNVYGINAYNEGEGDGGVELAALIVPSNTSLKVVNSDVYDNSYIGINLSSVDNVEVTNSRIYGNDYGIYAANANYLNLNTSLIHDNSYGVYADGSFGLTATGNTFNNNTASGLTLSNSYGSSDTNSFTGNTTGIEVANGGYLDIYNTTVNTGTTGLLITGNGSSAMFDDNLSSFNGQSDQYIRLADNAMYGDVLRVDGVTFDGKLAGSTTADDFAIEDKIFHKMDDDNVGLVLWKDQQLFATVDNLGIQQGINIASDNWTVNIGQGEFNENLTINDKAISLIGQGIGNTIINGGNNTAITIESGDKQVALSNFTVTTENAPYDILVDGRGFTTTNNGDGGNGDGIPMLLAEKPAAPVITFSDPTGENGALNLALSNILFSGTQTEAGLQIQHATDVGNVQVAGLQFRSTAPNGWEFVDVSGSAPRNSYGDGDINFNDTIFVHNYVQDIRLNNSTVDGNAENVTFLNIDGTTETNPFTVEDRVYHVVDNSSLGTIFYNGLSEVLARFGLGNLAADIANRTDQGDDYFNPLSVAGKIYNGPSLQSPTANVFNPTSNTRVNIAGNAQANTITIPGQTAAQLAGLTPAAGGDNPNDLNNLETSSGPNSGPGFQTNGNGTAKNIQTASCSVNFSNSFLSDSVGEVTGSCQ